jgi:ABC-type dipeptide/oligopeptide/nickel transport system permease subunit
MLRRLALAFLLLIALAAAAAEFVAPAGYEHQFRDDANVTPGRRFALGTDELGRDRLARLLHGVRISLLLAPATAALASSISVVLGFLAGYFGGRLDAFILSCTDLIGSVPLLLLLISLRAMLPLDVSPALSIAITFALLGFCGWPSGVKVIRSAVLEASTTDYMLQAAAAGVGTYRLLLVHMGAVLCPIVRAQFWLLVPQFLMAEANLGALGLGITEPLPSVGNLLCDLQNYSAVLQQPWRLAPVLVLVPTVGCLQVLLNERQTTT